MWSRLKKLREYWRLVKKNWKLAIVLGIMIFGLLISNLTVQNLTPLILIIIILFLMYIFYQDRMKDIEEKLAEKDEEIAEKDAELKKEQGKSRIVGISSDISELALKEIPLTIPITIEEYYNKNNERVYNIEEIENSLKNHQGFKKVSGTLTFSTKVKIGINFKKVRYNIISDDEIVITGITPEILSGFEAFNISNNIIVLQAEKGTPIIGDTYWTENKKDVFEFKDKLLPKIISKEQEILINNETEQVLALKNDVKKIGEKFIIEILGSKYSSIKFNSNSTKTPLFNLLNDDGSLSVDV